jgi:hypothetical protein
MAENKPLLVCSLLSETLRPLLQVFFNRFFFLLFFLCLIAHSLLSHVCNLLSKKTKLFAISSTGFACFARLRFAFFLLAFPPPFFSAASRRCPSLVGLQTFVSRFFFC